MQKFIVRHALRTTLMSLVIVLVSGGLIPHASKQDAVMGIERSQQPDTANHDDRAHEQGAGILSRNVCDRSAVDFTARQDPDGFLVRVNTEACHGRTSRYSPRRRKSQPSRS
jgi:hypothetical protein